MKLLQAVLTWLLIALPLGWGITRSVQKSLPLFQSAPPAAAKAG